MPEKWDSPSQFGPCSCSLLRRTARKVTAFYDAALRPSGLTVTQHAILVNIGRAGEITRTALAAKLGMDRTTLTRNLQPLEKLALILAARGQDQRERLLQLTTGGCRRLRQSYALWEKAQQAFAAEFHSDEILHLGRSLKQAEAAAEAQMTMLI